MPLILGYVKKFDKSRSLYEILSLERWIVFFISFLIGIFFVRNIFYGGEGIFEYIYVNIPEGVKSFFSENPILLYVYIFPIFVLLIFTLIMGFVKLVNIVMVKPLIKYIGEKTEDGSSISKRIIGLIFNIPRAIINVIIVSFIIYITSFFHFSPFDGTVLENANIYTSVRNKIIVPIYDSNSSKYIREIVDMGVDLTLEIKNKPPDIEILQKTTGIYLYNGITIEEGIKSNEEIDNLSKEIAKDKNNEYDKARVYYMWIGKNIEYDTQKADEVMSGNYSKGSGTIITYNTREGICFDYACMFVSFCEANGIKVRIITGEGFSGSEYVSHAWNQFYNPSEDRWVNVDPTFFKSGNFFDNNDFNFTHKNAIIAYETK